MLAWFILPWSWPPILCIIIGKKTTAKPDITIKMPFNCLSLSVLIRFCNRPTVFWVAINIGIVPNPKTNIIKAPVSTSWPAIAMSSAPYTKPQGKNPHKSPANSALPKLSIGKTFVRIGASTCQNFIPSFSSWLKNGKPNMLRPMSTNTAPNKTLGILLPIIGCNSVMPTSPAITPSSE